MNLDIHEPRELPPRPSYMSAGDAAFIRDTRCVAQLKLIDELVIIAQKKIKAAATLGLQDTLFVIPRYGTHNIWYDLKFIRASLMYHFRRQRFWVKKVRNDMLYISWRFVASGAGKTARKLRRYQNRIANK